MQKIVISYIERALSVLLSTFTCLGMFLVGNFIWGVVVGRSASTTEMIVIGLSCIILTYLLTNLMLDVRYMRLEIIAEEMEQEKKFMEEQERLRKKYKGEE